MGGVLTNDLVICNICKKQTSEAEIQQTKSGKLVCEECYDPVDPDQQSENEINENIESTHSRINSDISFKNYPSYVFTSENEKAEEIYNSNELSDNFEIPLELNIIDCPSDVNSDPNWFRIQFRNF